MKQLEQLLKTKGSEKRLYLLLAISLGLLMGLSGLVVSEINPNLPGDTSIFFQSRFILWDPTEKMIDNDFNITLITYNNDTHEYLIHLDDITYTGSYVNYTTIFITYNYSQINTLKILLDNELIFSTSDIRVTSGVTRDRIDNFIEPYLIKFLPFELTKFEWNLIYSGVVGAILCLPTAYFTVKWYRKRKGAQRV